jgi:branched-chain amino acid transport system substrate-binding protein
MALSDVLTANGESTDGVALIHMVNAYGAGLADSFKANWEAAGNTLCVQIGYDEATTSDYGAIAQSVADGGCTAVVMVSYNADGAMVINELAADGFAGQIYGTDGIAEEAIAAHTTSNDVLDGIIATKPASATPSEVSMTFDYLCANTAPCGSGIFTAEAFDAVTIMAFAAFTQMANPGITLSQAIAGTGQGWNGASGSITFLANGDTPGSGYCVGVYTADSSGVSFDCTQHWGASGLTDL